MPSVPRVCSGEPRNGRLFEPLARRFRNGWANCPAMFKKLFGLGKGSAEPETRSLEQRRKASRRPCAIEVECNVGKKGYMAQVVDMSVAGLRLHSDSPIPVKPKSVMHVTYPEEIRKVESLTTECIVRWSKMRESDSSQFIGLEFKDPKALGKSWVKAKMQDVGFQSWNLKELRAHHRVEAHLPATLDVAGEQRTCELVNIGLGGIFIRLHQALRAGASVAVKVADSPNLPGSVYKVVVRHQQQVDPGDPFGYGCAFESLRPDQEEAIKEYLVTQHAENWERTEEWPDLLYVAASNAAAEEVAIPDLASILEDSEPEADS